MISATSCLKSMEKFNVSRCKNGFIGMLMFPSSFMSLLVIAGRIYEMKHRPIQSWSRKFNFMQRRAINRSSLFFFGTKRIKNKFIGNACLKMHEANSNSNSTHVIPSALGRLIAQSCTEIPQVSVTTLQL